MFATKLECFYKYVNMFANIGYLNKLHNILIFFLLFIFIMI
jgi:hypothetical protein